MGIYKRKIISTRVSEENHKKLLQFIDKLNSKKGTNMTVSEYTWSAIKFYTNHMRNELKDDL